MLEECPFANNTLSIGVSIKGFPRSGQHGFGERPESWGIHNNRSESGVHDPAKVLASGRLVGSMRRLQSGDMISIRLDTSDPTHHTAELTLNEIEFRHVLMEMKPLLILQLVNMYLVQLFVIIIH